MMKPIKTGITTAITAAGMTGTVIGAYHAKNFVTEIFDNEILGIAAGITALLVGAVVVNEINKGVSKAFETKSQPLLIEVSDGYKIEVDDKEEVKPIGQIKSC